MSRSLASRLLLAGLVLSPTWAGDRVAAEAPGASELREEALVRRIHWPVRLLPRVPGGCEQLDAADVEVLEDGTSIVPDALERRRLETIHAVLIDTSTSMETRLSRAKSAARRYIEALPPQDQVLVASFSDNLVLHAPLTRDRERLERAIGDIRARSSTAFNDALYYVIRYLRSRPERKIVVIMTDGCDRTSLPIHPMREVLRMAEETPNLTIFPIGINLPASCQTLSVNPSPADGPAQVLNRLARHSGGRLFRTREAAALGKVFGAILARIEQEGFVTYRPLPLGDSPRDDGETAGRRRVRVRSRREELCRVKSAGPRVRVEGAPADVPALPATGGGDRVSFPDWWIDAPGRTSSHLDLTPEAIVGWASDILHERAALYSHRPYWDRGKYIMRIDGPVRFGRRDFKLHVPPFDLVQSLTTPQEIMLFLLQDGRAPFVPPDEAPGRKTPRRQLGESWIHGQTLLELREFFGHGLYGYPGYREFADRRFGEEYRKEMLRVVQELRRSRNWTPDELAALERMIEEQQPQPPPEQLQRFLAEWLGDIAAYDLVIGFEGWTANQLLHPELPDATQRWLLDLIDARWNELTEWFPAPTDVRIIAPLLPAYDADRELVGFYRILLPSVRRIGPPPDLVPAEPLALTFVRRMLDVEGGISAGPGRMEVGTIGYRFPSRSTRRRMVRGAKSQGLIDKKLHWRSIPMVHFELIVPEATVPPQLCTVLFDPSRQARAGPRAPICVHLGAAVQDWAAPIRQAILQVAPECRPAVVRPISPGSPKKARLRLNPAAGTRVDGYGTGHEGEVRQPGGRDAPNPRDSVCPGPADRCGHRLR